MERRTFLAGTGAVVLTASLAAQAQQAKKIYRIGYLSAGSMFHRCATLRSSFKVSCNLDMSRVEISSWSTEWQKDARSDCLILPPTWCGRRWT